MKNALALAAMLVLVLAFAPAAHAHLVTRPAAKTLASIEKSQAGNLAHARYVARHGKGPHVRWHRLAVRWLSRELRETRAAMRPRLARVSGVWTALASCESGGRWNYNGPSGFDGGLQFHPGTWSAYRRPGDPAYAYLASPAAQVAVAERVLRSQGWGAWPACSAKLGLR